MNAGVDQRGLLEIGRGRTVICLGVAPPVRYGRIFARVDRFFPSTRTCSDCGRISDKIALNVRSWECPCGSCHDRDVNAAINMAAGRADRLNDRGARVRPPAMVAPRGEAVIHPDTARLTRSVEGIFAPAGGENVNTWAARGVGPAEICVELPACDSELANDKGCHDRLPDWPPGR
ncbi:transposase [Micromonospora purpureochromogenes]|uniref:transposase n=1 Tax=Micromonospora purpureochromogenes TaxID=47872 RepID=UPI00331BA712